MLFSEIFTRQVLIRMADSDPQVSTKLQFLWKAVTLVVKPTLMFFLPEVTAVCGG